MGDVDTLSSNVTAIAEKIPLLEGLDGIDFTALPRLEASLGTAVVGDVLGSIQDALGSVNDPASANTFFGRIASMDGTLGNIKTTVNDTQLDVGKISRDSARAAQNSQSAKTKAGDAVSAAKKVMKALDEGDLDGTKKALKRMRAELAAAQASIDEIPKGGVVRDVYDEMQQMAGSMQAFAKSKGFTWLTTMQEIPGMGPQGGDAAADADKDAINTLNSNMQDMKVSMDFMKKLLDEMRYEPVVQDSLIGVE
jgi:hypothetical protein